LAVNNLVLNISIWKLKLAYLTNFFLWGIPTLGNSSERQNVAILLVVFSYQTASAVTVK